MIALTIQERLYKQITIKYPALTKCKYKRQQLEELWNREFDIWKIDLTEEKLIEFEKSASVINIITFLKIE